MTKHDPEHLKRVSASGIRVIGHGAYLPQNIVTNDELAKKIDTSDEWITKRTGIKRRHIAAPDERTSDLATRAAEEALKRANISAKDLDCVIVATTTPDHTFPSVASQVQANLGMRRGYAFDVQAACSGFLYGLSIADSLMRTGRDRMVMVIGADTLSRILDWEDRGTCVLFGDGAGALILASSEGEGSSADASLQRGVIASSLHCDGNLKPILHADGGPSLNQKAGVIRMQGQEVFRHAVVNMADAIQKVLDLSGLSKDEIDWFIPHQANLRILHAIARRFQIPLEKVVITVQDHANTSAASVPLAIDEAVQDGRIQEGHLLLFEAMGGGLTWGALLLRW